MSIQIKEVVSSLSERVQVVKLQDGRLAVQKTAPLNQNVKREIAWYKSQKGGVPRIFECTENSLLLEKADPGYTLAEARLGDDEKTTRLAEAIAGFETKPVSEVFPRLASFRQSFAHLRGTPAEKHLDRGQGLFRELTADQTEDVLLHGDLHHRNLVAQSDDWWAIDPHGYRGPAAAETAALLRNELLLSAIKETLERRVEILQYHLPFSPKEIRAWGFALNALSAAWHVEDGQSIPAETCALLDCLT